MWKTALLVRVFPVGHGQGYVSSVYIQGHTTAENRTNDPSLSVIFAFLSVMSPGQYCYPVLRTKVTENLLAELFSLLNKIQFKTGFHNHPWEYQTQTQTCK